MICHGGARSGIRIAREPRRRCFSVCYWLPQRRGEEPQIDHVRQNKNQSYLDAERQRCSAHRALRAPIEARAARGFVLIGLERRRGANELDCQLDKPALQELLIAALRRTRRGMKMGSGTTNVRFVIHSREANI